MNEVLYLAWRYLRFNGGKTTVLVASISLILFLPAGLHVAVREASQSLTARADATPLLVGAAGSAVDLTLAALYFREPSVEPVSAAEVERVRSSGLAAPIPLHLRFQAGGHRIVGTTTDYLDFRGLELGAGRRFVTLGECVLGAAAANALKLEPGDDLISTPAGAFDVAGSFPLKMTVVGVLAPAGTPDDEVVFVDVKTAWVIGGLAHGHDDVTAPAAAAGVLAREEGNVVANASVLSYTEITPENIATFHFHGDPATFPVDAVIAVPRDRKSGIFLRGRFAELDEPLQMVVPRQVVDELVETMFSVRNMVVLISLGLGAATIATTSLVVALSIRLRRRELETMRRIGASPGRMRAILASEVVLVVTAGVVIAAALTAAVRQLGSVVIRFLGV